MLYRLRAASARRRFDRAARDVLATAPLAMTDAPVRIVSMLQSVDLLAYLVAIKSVYPLVGRGRAVVVDDGSLTPEDRAVLAAHVPLLTVRPLTDGRVAGLPTGGTWERLAVLAAEARTAYAIQLDADIVGLGPLDAVRRCIDANAPFLLADDAVPGRRPVAEIAAWARVHTTGGHVQYAAERALGDVGLPPDKQYARATSAFTGVPRGAGLLSDIETFSRAMRAALGARWDEWGTEQITSNYAIANAGEARILAAPTYRNHAVDADLAGASLVHFYGTHRFRGGRYVEAARRAIRAMPA